MIAVLTISILTYACKKEGVGGDATIHGYVKAEKWNSTFTQRLGSYVAKDYDVFIQYGDTLGYDDRIHTDYNGYFEFPYLYKGDYRVYLYTRDSSEQDLSGQTIIWRDIHIGNRSESVDLDTLVVLQ